MKKANKILTILIFIFLYIPMAVLIVASFNSGKDITQFEGFTWNQYAELFRDETLLGLLGNSILIAMLSTGISIANQFDNILYQISCATSFAVMPYVSQNVGSKNIKRAMESVWKGILITVALGASFGALSAIFSPQLSSIMSSDPVVIAYSCQKMIIISSTYFICGINEIFGAALRGMGKPVAATTATLIFMCLLRFVWVYLIFPLNPNLTFLYLVWPVGWSLSIATLLFTFFPTRKKLYRDAVQPVPVSK